VTTQTATRYQRTYPGSPEKVSQVRRDVARTLDGCPVKDDAVLVLSEMVSNAIVHSESRNNFFTVRAERHDCYLWLEVEDLGGEWHCKTDEDYPHGLGIINILAGEDNWGIEGDATGRIVWARLPFPAVSGSRE
jgi:hypothetical protein